MKSIREILGHKRPPETEAVLEHVEHVEDVEQHAKELRLAKSEGYAEALADLVQGMKSVNSFALISVEPTVRRIQLKAKELSEV